MQNKIIRKLLQIDNRKINEYSIPIVNDKLFHSHPWESDDWLITE